MGRLDGKVAIVTGSARGTGAVTARLFAAEGARVAVVDVLDDRGAKVAEELGEAGLYVHLDITREQDWNDGVARVTEHFGPPTVLVNNAAVLHVAPLLATSKADFSRVVEVNATGTFLGIRAVAETMKAAGGGSIVNVSSISGLEGTPNTVAYVASKWAIRGISRVAAMELGPAGIRVNTVCPGPGNPEMVLPFLPEMDFEAFLESASEAVSPRLARGGRGIEDALGDVANMVLFLASDDSAFCTGADFPVDGGHTACGPTPQIAPPAPSSAPSGGGA